MNDDVLYDLGVDLNSNLSFANGDIALVTYNDNLCQAVINRMNTELDELDLFYTNYGSILTGFLGWKATDTTLQFIKSEINAVLKEEPRLVNYTVDVKYVGVGKVRIDLTLYPSASISIPLNLVLTTNGVVELETDEIIINEEE